MKFSDGVKFDTSGDYRTTRRHDGLYVVGGGMLIPVNDNEEAQKIIDDLNKSKEKKKNE